MTSSMNVSIGHIGARVHPDLVVDVAAAVDDRPLRVDLEREAIHRLFGPAVGDAKALSAALGRHRETIRRAIEAYVFARGVPLDEHVTLAWRDLRAFVDNTASASSPGS
jgi:hypothetical protein